MGAYEQAMIHAARPALLAPKDSAWLIREVGKGRSSRDCHCPLRQPDLGAATVPRTCVLARPFVRPARRRRSRPPSGATQTPAFIRSGTCRPGSKDRLVRHLQDQQPEVASHQISDILPPPGPPFRPATALIVATARSHHPPSRGRAGSLNQPTRP